ncbi:MAG: AAA family ATPase [Oscillospiraceae bacterium]|nr:AAA family ATPase [Oscillospiraceae bacterium]
MQNTKLKIFSMEEIETEYVSWLWKPYIPFGKITIVQGDLGDGKTTMMLAIAADLTRGRALPTGSTTEPVNVLFQTAEDGLADTIKPRLEDLGADCNRVHVIDESEKSLTFSDERIEQAIIKTEAKLLILDPLQAYIGSGDMNSAGGIRPLMKLLAGVAERTECAIVIIGHLNKGKSKSQYRGLGSIDIYAAARSVLTVGRIGEYSRAVVQGKSNLAPPGKAIAFELDPVLGFKWLGECDVDTDDVISGKANRPESQSDKVRRIILSALSDGSEIAANDIIEEAKDEGVSTITLKRVKKELGVISTKRGEQWYWQFCPLIMRAVTSYSVPDCPEK